MIFLKVIKKLLAQQQKLSQNKHKQKKFKKIYKKIKSILTSLGVRNTQLTYLTHIMKGKKRRGFLSHSKKKKKKKHSLQLNTKEFDSQRHYSIQVYRSKGIPLILNPYLVNLDLIMC